MNKDEPLIAGLPKEYYDDSPCVTLLKEFIRVEIGTRLKGYPEEDVRKAWRLVSSLIRAAEEVEEKAAEKGELNELVLMVIWNRLDLARRDEEKDAIRSLDLLYRRVETEILKWEVTPAMRLLNNLLNMHDGFDDEGWMKECKKRMVDTFLRPFRILHGSIISKIMEYFSNGRSLNVQDKTNQSGIASFNFGADDISLGPLRPPLEVDDTLLRVDFVREVNALIQDVWYQQTEAQHGQDSFDPESVASRLKQQEKQRAIRQVESLLDLGINLKW
ncbi:hypothetical protein ACJW30_07G007400 [Castanea mollissima]